MGGVDLDYMLIDFTEYNARPRVDMSNFWHVVDIAKVNAWILYKTEEILCGVSEKSLKCLKMFSLENANALLYAMMPASRGRPS